MNYQFDSIVTRKEANSIKDMIFNRAREREKDINAGMLDDVMVSARNSFSSKGNPFSEVLDDIKTNEISIDDHQKLDNIKSEDVHEKSIVEKATLSQNEKNEEDLNFSVNNIPSRLKTQTQLLSEEYAMAAVTTTMQEARAGLTHKKGFMDALNFLNSKAAVSLIRTRTDKFEAIF